MRSTLLRNRIGGSETAGGGDIWRLGVSNSADFERASAPLALLCRSADRESPPPEGISLDFCSQ